MDRRSLLLSIIGIICSLLGVVAFTLPWHENTTGMDLTTGSLGDLPSDIQIYMPTLAAIVMAIILVVSAINLIFRREKIPAFGVIILGFIVLGVTMAFGSWDPTGTKLMFDGGTGLYLMVIASCIYIFSGIAVYMLRSVPES